tara:strand:- start:223 stop:594 length:372 start_codon:yes stop_codon:yes gene_type:complete
MIEKLKKDIMNELQDDNKIHKDLLIKELDTYFQENELTFSEVSITNGTHQVRNRDAYKNKINKCKALVWNEGYGGQCSRSQKEGCGGFCKAHFEKGGEEWWLGTVDSRIERPIDIKGKLHYWK